MRILVAVILVGLSGLTAAAAFDSAAWLKKRKLQTREALRLKAAYAACVAKLQVPADNVTVPVETHPDGSVKTIIQARRAQYFMDSGLVWAEGVVVRKFKKDGSLDVRIDADNCVVDRGTKSGWAEGAARVTQDDTLFQGRNVYFSFPEGYVKVFRDSDLNSKNLKAGGLRP